MKFSVYVMGLIFLGGLARASVDESPLLNSSSQVLETQSSSLQTLIDKRWNHGAVDCSNSDEPAIEVFRYDDHSFIFRQSKCSSFEAPFIYLLVGESEALVIDTGASDSAEVFPIYRTIKRLLDESSAGGANKKITVIHSHSHRDHRAGDQQFESDPKVTVIAPNTKAIKRFFDFENRENGEMIFDLGDRSVTVFAVPGHHQDSIAIYDSTTRWLLTGDTFYPGYIYIKDWQAYRESISRIFDFTQRQPVSAILGTHIEMTREPGEYYPIGSLYQPNEASLVLTVQDLQQLQQSLETQKKPAPLVFDKFVVAPLSGLQKVVGGILGWFVD
ncbi:MAG: MBL fold metallo-hydrolase [Cellvibrionaceae bacterium]